LSKTEIDKSYAKTESKSLKTRPHEIIFHANKLMLHVGSNNFLRSTRNSGSTAATHHVSFEILHIQPKLRTPSPRTSTSSPESSNESACAAIEHNTPSVRCCSAGGARRRRLRARCCGKR
jgi:hypothetical protein